MSWGDLIAGGGVSAWATARRPGFWDDHEGEVLDMLVQRRRDSRAALRLTRKLLKKQGFAPKLQERLDAPPSPGTQ
jgi:hypothetical protein